MGLGPASTTVEIDARQVSVPTLVVSGDLDMNHFRNVARYLAGTIAGARLETLAWAAHLPNLERPSDVNDLIAGFLATADT